MLCSWISSADEECGGVAVVFYLKDGGLTVLCADCRKVWSESALLKNGFVKLSVDDPIVIIAEVLLS